MIYEDKIELKQAKFLLENEGLANKLTNFLNKPLEKGLSLLPHEVMDKVQLYTNAALDKALRFAIYTMDTTNDATPSNSKHKLAATISGGIGGFFGFTSALVELPISTTIMLRSIAEIAKSHGEDLTDITSRLACLEVLALGSNSEKSDTIESSYFSLRVLLAKEISEAAKFITRKGIIEEGAPLLVKMLNTVSSKFGIAVSQKLAGMALPIVGSISGAAINNLFIDHFQKTAEAHFTIRKLERKYGNEYVKQVFREL
jgi:hypothetical protein